jgi:cellulose synthase/poly-beta-1,6-N-acetylglucosamine synthase-like glycosyltransferase
MRIAIIIPAHNEQDFISLTLDSLCAQTYLPAAVVVVDDHSTDNTYDTALSYKEKLPLTVIKNESSAQNIPGTKVVQAFQKGLGYLELQEYDIICKFDADLIFPLDYLEMVMARFRESETIGMAAGHCSIIENGNWIWENQNNPDHIRGALKAYRVDCFKQIGGLKATIGWDTIDEMLARYHGWQVVTIPNLMVKHLKPTGAAYKSRSMELQGEAFYKMRYGMLLTVITSLKMAWNKKRWSVLSDYLKGYYRAKKKNLDPVVSPDQGQFIRSYRYRGIRSKLGIKN